MCLFACEEDEDRGGFNFVREDRAGSVATRFGLENGVTVHAESWEVDFSRGGREEDPVLVALVVLMVRGREVEVEVV